MTEFEIMLSVLVGQRTVARQMIRRHVLAAGVTARALSLAADGVVGTYYAPPTGNARRPAVLAFGGSEGGVITGTTLLGRWPPAATLRWASPTSRNPGCPATLAGIPLEYFGRALAFLRAQPGVDPHRVTVLGVSRGGELAQLPNAYTPIRYAA